MCNGTPFTVEKISPRVRIELGPLDRPALNPLSYRGSSDGSMHSREPFREHRYKNRAKRQNKITISKGSKTRLF